MEKSFSTIKIPACASVVFWVLAFFPRPTATVPHKRAHRANPGMELIRAEEGTFASTTCRRGSTPTSSAMRRARLVAGGPTWRSREQRRPLDGVPARRHCAHGLDLLVRHAPRTGCHLLPRWHVAVRVTNHPAVRGGRRVRLVLHRLRLIDSALRGRRRRRQCIAGGTPPPGPGTWRAGSGVAQGWRPEHFLVAGRAAWDSRRGGKLDSTRGTQDLQRSRTRLSSSLSCPTPATGVGNDVAVPHPAY